jgi:hypothetical protein
MRRFAGWGAVACCLAGLATAAAAPLGVGTPSKPPLRLTDAQRQQVLQPVITENSDDKLPADFQPVVGAKVPSQAKLPLHPLPRPLVYQLPVLKQYDYAKLPNNVQIVDPMTGKVVDVDRASVRRRRGGRRPSGGNPDRQAGSRRMTASALSMISRTISPAVWTFDTRPTP